MLLAEVSRVGSGSGEEGDNDPKLIEQPAPSSALRPAERAPRDKRRKTPEKR
jgi:hypothetical protein